MKYIKSILALFSFITLTGCLGMPNGVEPVQNFELNKYLGKWYEIARLDHSFERGLNNVTAEYTLNSNGSVGVTNTGFDTEKGEWKTANGTAKFVGDSNEGYLKVSFFKPFYGSYVVFELDKPHYQYAFVSGPDTSYLWLLSRTPTVPSAVAEDFVKQANALNFATENIVFVEHD